MDRAKLAKDYYANGYSCAQAVACAFAEDLGLSEDVLFRLAEGFGGGMGCGNVCGAVSGMVLVAGMVKSKGIDALPDTNKKETYALSKELIEEFTKKSKTIICADIKSACHLTCDECIALGIKILEEKLGL